MFTDVRGNVDSVSAQLYLETSFPFFLQIAFFFPECFQPALGAGTLTTVLPCDACILNTKNFPTKKADLSLLFISINPNLLFKE